MFKENKHFSMVSLPSSKLLIRRRRSEILSSINKIKSILFPTTIILIIILILTNGFGCVIYDPENEQHRIEFAQACEKAHDQFRILHQSEPLVPDQKLRDRARDRLDEIKRQLYVLTQRHGYPNKWGENILMTQFKNRTQLNDCHKFVRGWYMGNRIYNWKVPGFLRHWANFASVVWKNSTNIGCAANNLLLVCQYYPSTNVIGYYSKNVKPALN